MDYDPKSIGDQINCLARLTGAPDSFVGQVRDLFVRKGIPLESDATPYLRALEEAFVREETIRTTARTARKSVTELKGSVKKLGELYARQMEQLRFVQAKLRGMNLRAPEEDAPKGSRRALVTPPQSEDLPMVPGPEECQ